MVAGGGAHLELHLRVHLEQRGHGGGACSGSRCAAGPRSAATAAAAGYRSAAAATAAAAGSELGAERQPMGGWISAHVIGRRVLVGQREGGNLGGV